MLPVFGLANQVQQSQVGSNMSNATSAEAASQKESPSLASVAGGAQVVSAKGSETAEAVKPTPVSSSPVRPDFSADMVPEPKDPSERSIPITGPDELAKTLAMETQRDREAAAAKAEEQAKLDARERDADNVKAREVKERALEAMQRRDKEPTGPVAEQEPFFEPVASLDFFAADRAADKAFAEAIETAKHKEQTAQMQESVNVVRGEGVGMADTELAAA